MVFCYGLTDRSGAFTLANILAISSSEHLKALWLSLALAGVSTVICLLLAYPLAHDLEKPPYRKRQLRGIHLHSPDVDELPAYEPWHGRHSSRRTA